MVANKKLNIVDKKRGGLSGTTEQIEAKKRYIPTLELANSKLEMETIKPEEWKLETTSWEEKLSEGKGEGERVKSRAGTENLLNSSVEIFSYKNRTHRSVSSQTRCVSLK